MARPTDLQDSDCQEGGIYVFLNGQMRPVEPARLADELAPFVASAMVPLSVAEKLAAALDHYAIRVGGVASVALAEFRAAYPREETP